MPPGGSQAPGADAGGSLPASSRTLVIAARTEGESLAAKALTNAGIDQIPRQYFNAGLVLRDRSEVPHPYLAEALPALNTDSWRVFPDGRMETTYQLRPNLRWHDGHPLAAQDFVFAWHVYSLPELSVSATSAPMNQIDEVLTPTDETVVVRWKRPYADAGELQEGGLPPLPRHILEQPFAQLSPDAFAAHPFWTIEYVGLGPFRVVRWDRGVVLEAEAFDGYVLGRPAIDRIRVRAIGDPNTVLANLLAGEVHIAVDNAVPFQQGWVLKREWESRGGAGIVEINPGGIRRTENQLNGDRAEPKQIMDVRVRRALAHAVDKQAINDSIFEGLGIMADTLMLPSVSYFPEVDRVLMKYPHDLRRTEQLMNEAGLARTADSFYADPATNARLNWEIRALSGAQNEAVMSIMADGWRRAGFEMSENVFPAAQVSDREARAHFRTMFTTDAGSLQGMNTSSIPTAQNRWTGSNRGSWSNPEYDRLVSAWESSLDREQRKGYMIQMARLFSEELGSTPIFYHVTVTPHVAALAGVRDWSEDIHRWYWQS